MRTCHFSALVAGGLALALPGAALAQDEPGEWRFRVAPYFIAANMSGDVAAHGVEAEADLGPDDILNNLNFGFQGYFEARTDSWGIGLDAIYMNLDATDDARIAEIDVKQGAYTPTVFYRATPNLDLYAGARINDIGGDIDFQGPLNLPTQSQDRTWIDQLVGLRYSAPLGDKWNFQLSADVGGFGLGSDIAVNVWPMIGYELSGSAQLGVGYRVIYTDYDSGSGTDRFAYDVVSYGPVLGAAFDF